MSRKTLAACMVALVALSAVSAEAKKKDSDEPPSREVTGRKGVEGEIVGNEIPGSPFTKLEIGMSQKQVEDVVGEKRQDDAECGQYFTGKSFIPFHFGGDKVRTECAYKGLGRLVFTNQSDFDGKAVLIKIEYDASEDGYRDD
ncbi:hypothetical protein [Cognatilysobacter segetis]|uniref:hypothetical protein n=1 Tax=Cognatilysobacter segetis TaxID=2492394 RepID=UPI00105F24CC|nr:hypothetical protein [Lysobacter segetis]